MAEENEGINLPKSIFDININDDPSILPSSSTFKELPPPTEPSPPSSPLPVIRKNTKKTKQDAPKKVSAAASKKGASALSKSSAAAASTSKKRSSNAAKESGDATEAAKKKKRFWWSDELNDQLALSILEAKTRFDIKGLDFEKDLVVMYEEVRKIMAGKFEGQFGPVDIELIDEENDSDEEKLRKDKQILEDKKLINEGYNRIRGKVKTVRQDYRTAVIEGRRSGSGKLVYDNWDTLHKVWGGSPAVTAIQNQINGMFSDEEQAEDDDSDDDDIGNRDSSVDTTSRTNSTREDPLNSTPKYVDNKRKNMEKQLSAGQRDHAYLILARQELSMKQSVANNLAEATRQSSLAFESLSKSIEMAGKSIGDGLALLASAIGGNQSQDPSYQPGQYNNGGRGAQNQPPSYPPGQYDDGGRGAQNQPPSYPPGQSGRYYYNENNSAENSSNSNAYYNF